MWDAWKVRFSMWLHQEGTVGFLAFMVTAGIVWGFFLSYFWGVPFVPHPAPDDDTMHKTVIYFMLRGEDFYTAWRHAAVVCQDLSDLRIYRTPLVFYAVVALTWWAGDYFVFPLSLICVLVAACNLTLAFWTTKRLLGSGWAGLAAAFAQYAFFFNVIPRFQISLFAIPFLIAALYWEGRGRPWPAAASLSMSFLVKECFAFAFPAFLASSLVRRRPRHTLIYVGVFSAASALYLLHLQIARPVIDPHMLLAADLQTALTNMALFLWFGFILLYYNVLLPVTIGGGYTLSPVPPFLPYPLFLILLTIQVVLVWAPLLFWAYQSLRNRCLSNSHLVMLGVVMWLIPMAVTATAPVSNFSLWWAYLAVWRWFASSYTGFHLLTGYGWHMLRQHLKSQPSNPRHLPGAPPNTTN